MGVKKAIMGGKFNIQVYFFPFFGGEGFMGIWRELGGEGHQKALKHYFLRIFDENTLIYTHFQ